MEKTIISKKQLIISLLFFGGNTIVFIFYLYQLMYNLHLLQYLTNLSYYANSIFLLLCLISDIFLYIKNVSEEGEANYQLIDDQNSNGDNNIYWAEKLNNWNRNKYGVICNTFSFFVSISFWILYFLGENYIQVSNTFFSLLSTTNLHLIISILVIIDIFISKREHHFSKDYFDIIISIFLAYCCIAGIGKYWFNIYPYAFMEGSLLFLVFYVFISLVVLYVCYLFNVYLINIKKGKDEILLIKEI